jgi:hypothetical protein
LRTFHLSPIIQGSRAGCAPPSAPVACVRSRDIYGHACHAQSRGGSSAIGNCQSRVPQYKRLPVQATVKSPDTDQFKVDYRVRRLHAAPYSRFSGRLRRATGPVESTIRSSVPATGRLRRQSTQSRLIKSRSHHSHGLYQSGPLPTGIFALVPRPRPGSGRQQIFQSFADVLARLGIFLFWLHRSQLYCPFVFNSALWAGSRSASSRIASRGPATSGVKEVTACGSYGIIWLGSGRMCLPAQRELPSGEIRIFQLAMASRVGL